MHTSSRLAVAALLAAVAVLPLSFDAESASPAPARRTLDDYRHFRVAAIDLLGRMPTRDEIAGFERSDFDMGRWIDASTSGPAYAERLTRVYMDLLRLEPNLNFSSAPAQLYRHDVLGPDGKPLPVYFRASQRRERPETDGEFCLSSGRVGALVVTIGRITRTWERRRR